MAGPLFLAVEGVSKAFGPTRALDQVSLAVEKGTVFGLAGENGAGKSTLIKVLCGVHAPDAGRVEIDGRPHRPRDPAEAERAGIAVFHQEIPVCPHLSIAANVFLGPAMPRRGLSPDWKRMNARCAELYRTLLGEDIDPERLVKDCTAAEKQLALLVRVLSREARLVILDEPTTALTPPEVARLFAIIRRLEEQGITFLFVSHMLEELVQLSDVIGVLRDGKNVGVLRREEFDLSALSRMIAGRSLTQAARRAAAREGAPKIEVKDLSLPGEFSGVSFSLQRGEILGLAGLQGSGRSAVVRALFGAPPAASGEIRIDGRPVPIRRPADAMAAGIGFVPEDRKVLGIFHETDVKANVCMAGLDRLSRHGFTDPRRFREVAGRLGDDLSIKMRSVDAPIRSLSGGNQQKVLISRWLALKPSLLLMSEPTRGVDVGSKEEIVNLVLGLSAEGYTFVISSSELDELVRIADRILVMNRGRVARQMEAGEATKDQVILAATT
ncbi:MAG TPA: sugar ABC transporter ATP-binding protein [Anaeromyxobacteraceae bacterium]|nr:sugar ABC transporter ATP-binding protein [Anaeromyxobacteraceae bacterium]